MFTHFSCVFMTLSMMACTGQSVFVEKPVQIDPESRSSASDVVEKEKCDFSQYSPARISHFVINAATKRVKPKYPPEAIEQGIQGLVQVKILVNVKGEVEKACAIDGDEILQEAAIAAALEWKFKPYFGLAPVTGTEESVPAHSCVMDILPFRFVLDQAQPTDGLVVRP